MAKIPGCKAPKAAGESEGGGATAADSSSSGAASTAADPPAAPAVSFAADAEVGGGAAPPLQSTCSPPRPDGSTPSQISKMSTISDVIVGLFRVPLREVLVDAAHGDHTHFELVTATVVTADGQRGVGYTYTGGKGGRSIAELLRCDLRPYLCGQDPRCIEALWAGMAKEVHYVGRGGVASFAISAVDIALWDLRCRAMGEPLWRALGGAARSCRCYAGGIDLAYPLPKVGDLLGSFSYCY
jgi:hypothetical protein